MMLSARQPGVKRIIALNAFEENRENPSIGIPNIKHPIHRNFQFDLTRLSLYSPPDREINSSLKESAP